MIVKTHLVVHHSATADSGSLSVPVIRRVHTQGYGWRDIAYNWMIEWVDRRDCPGGYEMLSGRPPSMQAAGERRQSMNRVGLHVLFVGNFDKEEPDIAMWQFAAPHLIDIMEVHDIPTENLIGHREILGVTKSCPGKLWDMEAFRDFIGGF